MATEDIVKLATFALTVLTSLVAGIWAALKYSHQRAKEKDALLALERDKLDQQRREQESRRAQQVGQLLVEFNKVSDGEKKIWTVLALSLYPEETAKLLSMSLGHLDEDTARSAMLALVSIGERAMPELIHLNKIAQVLVLGEQPHEGESTDIYDVRRLSARSATVIQNVLLRYDGGSIGAFDLDGVKLTQAIFRGMRFTDGNFSKVDLTHADFRDSTLRKCRFRGSALEGASFVASRMAGCDFTGSSGKLLAARAQFEKSTLDHAHFEESELDGGTLTACSLNKTKFGRSSFQGATISDCEIVGAGLGKVALRKAVCRGVKLVDAYLVAADFSEAVISNSEFQSCSLMGLKALRLKAAGTKFVDCDFGGANFASADLTRASFTRCKFGGSDFRTATLLDATFDRCETSTGKFDIDVAARSSQSAPSPSEA